MSNEELKALDGSDKPLIDMQSSEELIKETEKKLNQLRLFYRTKSKNSLVVSLVQAIMQNAVLQHQLNKERAKNENLENSSKIDPISS